MNKTANIDAETGIRFGVIHQNKVSQAWSDSSEPDCGDTEYCPICGAEVIKTEDVKDWSDYDNISEDDKDCDWFCPTCEAGTDDPEYIDETSNYIYNQDGYKASCGDSGDIFVMKSPYYAETRECSPCAPNAGDLSSPEKGGFKTYCFGPDWFEDDKPPYAVYRVEDDTVVCYAHSNNIIS